MLLFDTTIVLSSSLSILLLWEQNLEGSNNSEIIDEEDDNSVLTITNVVGNMQMASNAQSQAVQEEVTELRREIGFLRAELSARNQGAANNSQAAPLLQWAPMPPPPPLAPPQPPQAAYNTIPPPLPQTAFNAIPPPNNACQPPNHPQPQGRGRGGEVSGEGENTRAQQAQHWNERTAANGRHRQKPYRNRADRSPQCIQFF